MTERNNKKFPKFVPISGFIDLATFSENEKHLYSKHFEEKDFPSTYEGTWETQVPTPLERDKENPNNFIISRGADILHYIWVDVKIPSFGLERDNRFGASGRLKWSRNLAHNIFEGIDIVFDDEIYQSFDSYTLDFLSNFTIGVDKIEAYNHAIGNRDELTQGNTHFEKTILCLPIPTFFSKSLDKTIPLPAICYTVAMIKCRLRSWERLLTLENIETGECVVPEVSELSDIPTFSLKMFANYLVTNSEKRKRIVTTNHKIVFDSYKTAVYPIEKHSESFVGGTAEGRRHPFTGSVKALFFAVRNKKISGDWSNYMIDGKDPLVKFKLFYENSRRLSQPKHHSSFIFPFFHAKSVPAPGGMHMYPYFHGELNDSESFGSTNYGKINTSLLRLYYDEDIDISDCDVVMMGISKNILKINNGKISKVSEN